MIELVALAPDAAAELLEAAAAAENEATAELSDGSPQPTVPERVARYRSPGSSTRWAALEGGTVLGVAELRTRGTGEAGAEIRVRPSARRRGVGTLLFRRVEEEARARAERTLSGQHATDAGAAFARSLGAVDGERSVKSILRLGDVPPPERAARLVTWSGPVADELVESFVAARAAMPAPWTVERHREDEHALLGRGLELLTTVALDGGRVIALAGVRVNETPFAVTDDTVVVPDARGRGLATAVKRENLRQLRARFPHVELVGTMNAEDNAAMRAVNTRLGFVPTVTLTTALVSLGE